MDLFENKLGSLKGEIDLKIDTSVRPTQLPTRKVPVALRGQLRDKLDRLEAMGVISRVNDPTDWVSSLVITQKRNGSIRVCVDPKPLNKALKRSHYPLPVTEDILPQLAKARVFSVCDVRNGFWHIPLNERSSRLTTFSTPFGRYCWTRLPFGISPAPEIFQRQLEVALENLPGINIIADDILIHGEGDSMVEAERDHDRCLVAFLKRCREQRIFLNLEKFRFCLQEVRYAGHVFTAQGLKID